MSALCSVILKTLGLCVHLSVFVCVCVYPCVCCCVVYVQYIFRSQYFPLLVQHSRTAAVGRGWVGDPTGNLGMTWHALITCILIMKHIDILSLISVVIMYIFPNTCIFDIPSALQPETVKRHHLRRRKAQNNDISIFLFQRQHQKGLMREN